VGGYIGGHLARAGHDVRLIDPWPEHVEAMRAGGLRLSGMTEAETCTVRPPTMHLTEVQSLVRERPIDIAIVAVKSYDTEWATMMIRPFLAPDGYVVSAQNCINEAAIAGVVGWGRTVGCIVARVGVELVEPGRIVRNMALAPEGDAVFRVGEVHGRTTPRIKALARMIAEIDSVSVTTNLWGERWSKLCVNAMRNPVSAATGLSGNGCDRHSLARRVGIATGGEAVRVGQALGYEIEHIGPFPPARLAAAQAGDGAALAEIEARLEAGSNVAARSDAQRPSMAQDIAKGRRTEIDHLNGFIAREGAELGIATPANIALTELVRRVERGEIAPSPDHLADIPLR
jgi:2-dehydropantoate 2-reductase